MSDMPLYLHFLFAFVATIGFAVFLNSPNNTLFINGLIGGLSWSVYAFITITIDNTMMSNFFAAVTVSLLSEFSARFIKQPAIVFIIPGIILLVPGVGMYKTILFLIQNNYTEAIAKGADVLFAGVSMAMGVLIVTSLFKSIRMAKQNKESLKKEVAQ